MENYNNKLNSVLMRACDEMKNFLPITDNYYVWLGRLVTAAW